MAEDSLDDLAKRRLQSELDAVPNIRSRLDAIMNSDVASNGEFFRELHRRGLPDDIDAQLLQWPMAGLTHGAAGLASAGLEPAQLFNAVTKFYDTMLTADTVDIDLDIEGMFADLELSCECGSVKCPRSPFAYAQITSALASCFASLEVLLPDFDVPELSSSNPTDDEKQVYNDACDFLYKQYRASLRTKVLAIIELNLIVMLKAGIIQAFVHD